MEENDLDMIFCETLGGVRYVCDAGTPQDSALMHTYVTFLIQYWSHKLPVGGAMCPWNTAIRHRTYPPNKFSFRAIQRVHR